MIATETKLRAWGNSIGVIIPSETVKDLSISPGEELIVDFKKKENVLKELYGALKFDKNWEKEFQKERKELEGRWI